MQRQPYIVALTASALTDDLEATRTAGMDAHLAKPTRIKDLDTVLVGVLRRKGSRPEPPAAGALERSAAIRRQLGELSSGDAELDRSLFDEILTAFLESTPPLLERMHTAADRGDTQALAAPAHTLKGSAGNLAMTDLCAACQSLESRANAGDGAAAAALVPTIDVAYDGASQAVELLRAQLAAAA